MHYLAPRAHGRQVNLRRQMVALSHSVHPGTALLSSLPSQTHLRHLSLLQALMRLPLLPLTAHASCLLAHCLTHPASPGHGAAPPSGWHTAAPAPHAVYHFKLCITCAHACKLCAGTRRAMPRP